MNVHVDGAVHDVAKHLQADLENLTAGMTAMFVDVIPEFRHDDAVRRLMIASTSSNLLAILDMLALGISLDDITVPPAAAEYARRFAQHDLSLEALLRAYRLGEHMVVQRAMTALGRLELSMEDALATTSRIALLTNSYIDQVIEGVIDIYENERRRWDARSDAARAAQVRAVLDTEGLDLASAEKMLSTSLRGWHLAAIIWTRPGSPAQAGAGLRAGAAILAAATGKTPLTISADEQTYWAWISSAGKPVLDVPRLEEELGRHPALRIAIGDPSSGLDGFRQTFRDAQRARNVAVTGADPDRSLTLHSHVALAGLLVDHLTDVKAWAERVLGDLMRDDDATIRLRETVQVFLDARGSFTDAATRMHVHKNTVHYRVRKAEEILGHPLTESRLDIEVALLACAQLGLRSVEGARRPS
ncbi:helix-turn-helix domain-containing protein [Streptomyces sp. DSM 40750]|uniref:helix-turn-helix domain-containing protein n=1 Tax=Streptomyces sp. DSM 40750 TaxID=2801030 RepID=UPI00214B8D03|nr:helix-turn-helix domain-containing protein [Streptomyces sp. DSM 40750]UUU24017.1 helix-turn-helix domain-containing protein [Streptomyces sp. DSM 40750]